MFGMKNEKRFYKELEGKPSNLFKQVAIDFKNENIVEQIGFYPKDDSWYYDFIETTEKLYAKLKKDTIKLGIYEEQGIRKVGVHLTTEVTIDEVYFEIDFNENQIILDFQDEQEESGKQLYKQWIEFEDKDELYQYIYVEFNAFLKECRS